MKTNIAMLSVVSLLCLVLGAFSFVYAANGREKKASFVFDNYAIEIVYLGKTNDVNSRNAHFRECVQVTVGYSAQYEIVDIDRVYNEEGHLILDVILKHKKQEEIVVDSWPVEKIKDRGPEGTDIWIHFVDEHPRCFLRPIKK